MNTFEIISWVLGAQRKIIVTEPLTWNGAEFKLKLEENSQQDDLVIKLENGHWQTISLLSDPIASILPRQLEIDSIGFEIAKHWCNRLKQQLENFQACI